FRFRFDVAINTVVVRGCGNEPHRIHEFIDWDSLEHGNVFEGLFRHQLRCRRSLTRCRWATQQPETNRRQKEVHIVRLLLVPTNSFQGPSLPESPLDGIDTIFFSHVPVCCPVRPLTPETFLDLL